MHVKSTTILPLIYFKQQSVTNIKQQHNLPSAWIMCVCVCVQNNKSHSVEPIKKKLFVSSLICFFFSHLIFCSCLAVGDVEKLHS